MRIHAKEKEIRIFDWTESTGIGAGTDPAEGLSLLDDPRRRNEDRDPDKAARVSSSEDSSDSISESDGTLAESF